MSLFIRSNLRKNVLHNLYRYKRIEMEKCTKTNMYQIVGVYDSIDGWMVFGAGYMQSDDYFDVLLEYDNKKDAEDAFGQFNRLVKW